MNSHIRGLESSTFKVKMGGHENTDQITAALGFSFSDMITQENFPIEPSETAWEDEIEIIYPGWGFSEEEGLKFLDYEELLRPTYAHGIRFAQQHGKTATFRSRSSCIIFLHEVQWGPDRSRRIVCLYRGDRYCALGIRCPDAGFYDFCLLAGVRSRKPRSRQNRKQP